MLVDEGEAFFTVAASSHEGSDLHISAVPTYGDPDIYANADAALSTSTPTPRCLRQRRRRAGLRREI